MEFLKLLCPKTSKIERTKKIAYISKKKELPNAQ